jgi:hypothetical protein
LTEAFVEEEEEDEEGSWSAVLLIAIGGKTGRRLPTSAPVLVVALVSPPASTLTSTFAPLRIEGLAVSGTSVSEAGGAGLPTGSIGGTWTKMHRVCHK